MKGTIKSLVKDKGYGFIRATDGKEFFFHRSAVLSGRFDGLKLGDTVEFDEDDDNRKGPRACDVELV